MLLYFSAQLGITCVMSTKILACMEECIAKITKDDSAGGGGVCASLDIVSRIFYSFT